MKLILALVLAVFVTSGCVSQTSRYYGLADPGVTTVEKGGVAVPADGVTWNLSVESHRKDFGIVFVFWSTSNGPPYAVKFNPYGEGLGKSVTITKLEVTMPDGISHDLLNGQSVELPVKDYNPRQANYKSAALPLRFKAGARVSVELHCQMDGTDVVLKRTFVGRKRRNTQSMTDALGAI